MSTGGKAIPRLQDLSYFDVAMDGVRQGFTFEQIRRALVDRARDLDRESDLEGSFDEAKWERRRKDPREHANNAVEVLKEAMRLGWVERRVLPSGKDSAYLHANEMFKLLPPGQEWAELVTRKRPEGYNALAGVLIETHPQLEKFLTAIGARPKSASSSLTVPLLRWDQEQHLSEDLYLTDLVHVVVAAAQAGRAGWTLDEALIDQQIRSYVQRIRARRSARGKTQSRKEFLKTCEEAVTKVAFGGADCPIDYISMELMRRWARFLGVGNFSYYAPGPYALRLWGTGTVEGAGQGVAITRRIGPGVRKKVLATLLDVWRERRATAAASMYAPVWELRAAVCWRLRIADTEWDKAIIEMLHGSHDPLPYQVHLDQASLGPAPASTRPLVLPSPAGARIYNVMTLIQHKENR